MLHGLFSFFLYIFLILVNKLKNHNDQGGSGKLYKNQALFYISAFINKYPRLYCKIFVLLHQLLLLSNKNFNNQRREIKKKRLYISVINNTIELPQIYLALIHNPSENYNLLDSNPAHQSQYLRQPQPPAPALVPPAFPKAKSDFFLMMKLLPRVGGRKLKLLKMLDM